MGVSTNHAVKLFTTATFWDLQSFTGWSKVNELRLILIILSRYGGWYTDTDTITVRETTEIQTNTVALSGLFVANGNLFFQKQYEFLRLLLIQADKRYTGIGNWIIDAIMIVNIILN